MSVLKYIIGFLIVVIIILLVLSSYRYWVNTNDTNDTNDTNYAAIQHPIHLGLIPDGNRRWRKKNGGVSIAEYISHLESLLDTGVEDLPIASLSLYMLSADNTQRTDDTVNMIESVLEKLLEYECDKVKINFVGELDDDSKDAGSKITNLCKEIESKCTGTFPVYVAIYYSPTADMKKIIDGCRVFQPNIDLVIRTGGEKRSSGFFPMHTLYSEWVYIDKLFPDITKRDIVAAIDEFSHRKRNFGK